MSHQLSRRARTRIGRAALVALALLTVAVLMAVAAFDLPRWVHNLADLLQIVTALIAFLAWEGTRRGRS